MSFAPKISSCGNFCDMECEGFTAGLLDGRAGYLCQRLDVALSLDAGKTEIVRPMLCETRFRRLIDHKEALR